MYFFEIYAFSFLKIDYGHLIDVEGYEKTNYFLFFIAPYIVIDLPFYQKQNLSLCIALLYFLLIQTATKSDNSKKAIK